MAFAERQGTAGLAGPAPRAGPAPSRQTRAHLWVAEAPPSSHGPSPRQVTARLQGASPGAWELPATLFVLGCLGKGCHLRQLQRTPARSPSVKGRNCSTTFAFLVKRCFRQVRPHPSLKTRPSSSAATGAEGTTWIEEPARPRPLLASVRPCALLSPLLSQQQLVPISLTPVLHHLPGPIPL